MSRGLAERPAESSWGLGRRRRTRTHGLVYPNNTSFIWDRGLGRHCMSRAGEGVCTRGTDERRELKRGVRRESGRDIEKERKGEGGDEERKET